MDGQWIIVLNLINLALCNALCFMWQIGRELSRCLIGNYLQTTEQPIFVHLYHSSPFPSPHPPFFSRLPFHTNWSRCSPLPSTSSSSAATTTSPFSARSLPLPRPHPRNHQPPLASHPTVAQKQLERAISLQANPLTQGLAAQAMCRTCAREEEHAPRGSR